jgi:hypothetical protein
MQRFKRNLWSVVVFLVGAAFALGRRVVEAVGFLALKDDFDEYVWPNIPEDGPMTLLEIAGLGLMALAALSLLRINREFLFSSGQLPLDRTARTAESVHLNVLATTRASSGRSIFC